MKYAQATDTVATGGEATAAATADGEAVSGQQQLDAAQARQPTATESFFAITKSLIIRAVIIYFITSFFKRNQEPQVSPVASGDSKVAININKIPAINLFEDGMVMDLYVYISEQEKFNDFSSNPVWFKEDLVYGDWTSGKDEDGTYTNSLTIPASENVKNNGSIYIHVYFVKSGFSPDPKAGEESYNKRLTTYSTQKLNKHKKRKYKKTTNLITGETEASEEEKKAVEAGISQEIISHWHPNLTISIVHDFTAWSRGAVPPPLDEYVEFVGVDGDRYKPITFLNSYWNLVKDYQAINHTTEELSLTLTFQPLSLFKWQLYAAQAMKNKWPGGAWMADLQGDESDEDQDAIKEAFLETSPYLLGLTMAISILHSIFEFLAFKNDIQFWNNRQSLEGLSVRSVFFNVFQSLIVLLYVLDNETNFVIKVSCFIGLGIEVWKITKVMDVTLNRTRRILGIPTLSFADKSSYTESETKKFDRMAFGYLSWALFPILGGYCIYSLIYQEHKGYYSFVLSMLYGFLLTFGFIMMTPQLFINYKMKSVAHLPWRMLTYKALNTFIDDIFAFVIKMPTLYRIGCLRDDVIFFIFLYQRYIYRIDPTRLNEFGFSQEMLDEKSKTVAAVANGTTAAEEPQKTLEEKKED
ncbi:unnamed protein product, partial [Meganyctiphanes norvegica]